MLRTIDETIVEYPVTEDEKAKTYKFVLASYLTYVKKYTALEHYTEDTKISDVFDFGYDATGFLLMELNVHTIINIENIHSVFRNDPTVDEVAYRLVYENYII